MGDERELKPIAYIYTDFPDKFGIPRQSNLVEGLKGRIVFEPEFRSPEALRGLEEYDYLWLIWGFQETDRGGFHPTVRPPRLGGNVRKGVFATRSPFRPNALGLSSVKLEEIRETKEGPQILVSGIDMRNRTPVYDIKPYLPYVDSHPEARGGFARLVRDDCLEVDFPETLLEKIPGEKRQALTEVLRQDPRPHYQKDAGRVYGFSFNGFEVRFQVDGTCLKVISVEKDNSPYADRR